MILMSLAPKLPDYSVTSTGDVISHKNGRNRVLKPGSVGNGYLQIMLYHSGVPFRVYIHRLVAHAFLGLDLGDSSVQVNHKDGNKHNNDVSNLELVTCSDNHKHAYKFLDRKHWNIGKFGDKHHRAVSLKVIHPNGSEEVITGLRDFCRKYGLNPGKLSEVSNGLRKQHKGFKAERIHHE